MMILMGTCLLGLVPITAKSLRAQLAAGKIAPAEISKRIRNLKLGGACGLFIGCCLVAVYAFHLRD
jgi:hypothetical protein